MGVGFSDGTSYKDETEWLANVDNRSAKQISDQSEINQNSTSGDFQSRFGAAEQKPLTRVLITMPPQAPEKPAGALESSGGTETPGNGENIENDYISKLKQGSDTTMDSLFGTGENDIRPALGSFYDHVKNAFSLPGDVYAGKIDPSSVQGIERAADLAGLLITGPAPVAAKVADGSLGSFMGVRSKVFDRAKLSEAQEMHGMGEHPDDIWNKTGTFKGADGRWRQEIDDSSAKLKPEAFDTTLSNKLGEEPVVSLKDVSISKLKGGSAQDLIDWFAERDKPKKILHLPDVLDHPELFKAYPDLKAVRVEPLPKYLEGSQIGHFAEKDGPAGTIRLKGDLDPEFVKSVILHEVQHNIQAQEGFARGGNAQQFRPAALDSAEADFIDMKAKIEPQIAEELGVPSKDVSFIKRIILADKEGYISEEGKGQLKLLKDVKPAVYKRLSNIVDAERLLQKATEEHYEKYMRLMGEVEARNVQARLHMSTMDRQLNPPKSTQDRPTFSQIESHR